MIEELSPRTGIGIDPRYRSRDHWINSEGGQMFASSAPGGSFSGKGANLIIADDLVKDMRQVNSATQRRALETYMRSELLSRLEPHGKIVCVLARRHPEDILSFLLSQNAELEFEKQWHFVTHSALRYGTDGAATALWPERFSVPVLQQIEQEHALTDQSWIFECLYQQNPTGDPSSRDFPDSYFSNDIWYDELPPNLDVRFTLLSIDPSKGQSAKAGDYTAFALIRYTKDGTKWVDDSQVVRMPIAMIIETAVTYMKRGGIDGLSCETTGFQEMILNAIVAECQKQGITCPAHAYAPVENKIVRMRMTLDSELKQKRIRFRDTFHNRLGINQMKAIPTGAHDDFPDTLTQNILLSRKLTKTR